MSEEEDDDAIIAAEHVLGLLEPAEEAAFQARLAVDPGFRALVARWTEDLAGLADAIPEARPPARVEAALMRRLFPERRGDARPGWFGRLLSGALTGLATAVVVLAAISLDPLGLGDEAPSLAATVAAADGSLVVAASYTAGTRILAVERSAGQAPPGRVLELWLIQGEAAPVSLGLLPPGGSGAIAVPVALAATLEGGVLAISDEPPGGSPTGSPTGTVLATGAITAL